MKIASPSDAPCRAATPLQSPRASAAADTSKRRPRSAAISRYSARRCSAPPPRPAARTIPPAENAGSAPAPRRPGRSRTRSSPRSPAAAPENKKSYRSSRSSRRETRENRRTPASSRRTGRLLPEIATLVQRSPARWEKRNRSRRAPKAKSTTRRCATPLQSTVDRAQPPR